MILETERLYLREMKRSDFNSLCKILQDEDTRMTKTDMWVKHYRGVDMPHYRYIVRR